MTLRNLESLILSLKRIFYKYKRLKHNYRDIILNVVIYNVIYYQNIKRRSSQKMSIGDEISGKHSQQH